MMMVRTHVLYRITKSRNLDLSTFDVLSFHETNCQACCGVLVVLYRHSLRDIESAGAPASLLVIEACQPYEIHQEATIHEVSLLGSK